MTVPIPVYDTLAACSRFVLANDGVSIVLVSETVRTPEISPS